MPVVLRVNAVFHDPAGPLPSPYMLFTHQVRPGWRDRIPVVVHVDGRARVQTVHREQQPLVARVLEAFEPQHGWSTLPATGSSASGRRRDAPARHRRPRLRRRSSARGARHRRWTGIGAQHRVAHGDRRVDRLVVNDYGIDEAISSSPLTP